MTDVEVPSAEQPARHRIQPSGNKSLNAGAYNVIGSLVNKLPNPPIVRFCGITILALATILVALIAVGARSDPSQWSWSFAAVLFFLIGALCVVFFASISYQVFATWKTPVLLDTEGMREELIWFTAQLESLEKKTKETIQDFRHRIRGELERRLEDAALQQASRKKWEKHEAEIREKIRRKVEDALANVREIIAQVGNLGLDAEQQAELEQSLQALQRDLVGLENEFLGKLQALFRFMDLSKDGGLLTRWCQGEAQSTITNLKSLYKILVKLPVREQLAH